MGFGLGSGEAEEARGGGEEDSELVGELAAQRGLYGEDDDLQDQRTRPQNQREAGVNEREGCERWSQKNRGRVGSEGKRRPEPKQGTSNHLP